MVSLTKREAIKIIESTNREYERFLCNLNRRYHTKPERLSLEAAVLAQQYDDVYRCVNSSLWRFYKNTKSGDLKAILDEYLILCRNFNFRTLQSFPKEEFTVSETEDKMPEAIDAALEKLEGYGDEQIQKAVRQCREGKRIIEFSSMDERQNGQTYRVNDFYSHYITDRFKENTIENQVRLAVTLAHELKRNAATDSLEAETQEIVLSDTKIIESFENAYGEGIYKKFPEYGILHYIKKIFGETELKEFADYAFDSTGSYWKVNEAGDLADDGKTSRVADAKGSEIHSGTKGLQGTLQEWLGMENAYAALMQPAGFEWDGKKWSKNPGKISNSILKQKLTEQQYELIKNAANLINETDGKEEKDPEKVNYMQLIIQNLKDAIKSPFQLNLISSVIKYFILDHYAEDKPVKHTVTDEKSAFLDSSDEINYYANIELSNILRQCVGANYSHTRMPTNSMMDCSGMLVYALDKMGYEVPYDLKASKMSSGSLDWIVLYDDVKSDRQGLEGILNFYNFEGEEIDHVNYGVGMRKDETENQIMDASYGSTWQSIRNNNEKQIIKAEANKVNQMYAPFSTKTSPVKQGYIDFTKLKRKVEYE